jgi:hypothetical protein
MEEVGEAFEWYADWAAEVSPLYERIARGVADDPAALGIAAEASPGQPPPQLLLGAVHALLLGGRDHPLASFYPTCTDDPADGDPVPPFRGFCRTYEDEIREIVSTRRVQTNDVGRSAVLLPAFEYVARRTDRAPLALVEIGASAGLNLHWDRYRYEYGGRGVVGDPDSPVRIESAVRGDREPPLPEALPEVAFRVGNDLNPLDVADPDDARWLRALVVPDQRRRHERLAAAIDLARETPPTIVAGDALDVLPDLLETVPEGAALCVFSTHTIYQLGEDGVAELRATLAEFGRERPLHWLSGDPESDLDHRAYRHIAFADGAAEETRLAEHTSYGEWIRWLADGGR